MEMPHIEECSNCGDDHVNCDQVGKLQWRCVCQSCGELGDVRGNKIDAITMWNNPSSIADMSEMDSYRTVA